MFEFKLSQAVVGAIGALLATAMHLIALAFSEPPPTRQQWARAAAEGAVSMVAGTLAAMFIGPSVAAWELWGFGLDEHAASFLIGFVAWRLMPVALHAAQSWIRAWGQAGPNGGGGAA